MRLPLLSVATMWTPPGSGCAKSKLNTGFSLTGSKLFNTIMGGQNIFVSGGAAPILQADMTAKKTIISGPDGFNVPKGAKVYQPSPDQQVTGKTLVAAQWPTL